MKSLDTKHANEGTFLNELHDVKSLLPFLSQEVTHVSVWKCDGMSAPEFTNVWSGVHYTASFLKSDPSFTPCILNTVPFWNEVHK